MVKMSPKKRPDDGGAGVVPTKVEKKVDVPELELLGLEPHRYRADVRWPASDQTVAIEINGGVVVSTSARETQTFSFEPEKNKAYLVRLLVGPSDQPPVTAQQKWEFSTPVDIVLPNPELQATITANASAQGEPILLKAQRLFLNSDAETALFTMGRDLHIDTEELISNDAHIATFPLGQRAELNRVGRNGGAIVIKAKRARGALTVETRGEHGGDGSQGAPYLERAPTGSPGFQAMMGFGGVFLNCWTEAGNGFPGKPGADGRKGLNGRRGGNSGHLILEVSEPSKSFSVIPQKEIGHGGRPGAPGEPQLGGFGGPPGKKDPLNLCKRNANPGPPGPNGNPGQPGESEGDGIEEVDCIHIGEGFGRCQ
jgi:hypothetical protein